MTTEPDNDVEARCYCEHPIDLCTDDCSCTPYRDEFERGTAALQVRIHYLEGRVGELEALLSLVRFDPAKGVYPDTPGWRLIQERDALQERIKELEEALDTVTDIALAALSAHPGD